MPSLFVIETIRRGKWEKARGSAMIHETRSEAELIARHYRETGFLPDSDDRTPVAEYTRKETA